MHRYFVNISDRSSVSLRTGNNLAISADFKIHAMQLIANCNFFQKILQSIIYDSYGPEFLQARKSLRDNPNPKSRVDFLCSFPYPKNDDVVAKVFEFAKFAFKDLYELRNVLAHEIWSECDDFPNSVLFSSLDESSRLSVASQSLWHQEGVTTQSAYEASIRFIRSIKVVTLENLHLAINDLNVCSWAIMHINNIINENDTVKKDLAKNAFFTFKGTSHLFPEHNSPTERVEYSSKKGKDILN